MLHVQGQEHGAGIQYQKWRLSFKALKEISDKQLNILHSISGCVSNSGIIAYITCSILKRENEHVVTEFLNKNGHFL